MSYVLGICYQGNGRKNEESKAFALQERKDLESLASRKFKGVCKYLSDSYIFRVKFEDEENLKSFRRTINLMNHSGKLHYYQLQEVMKIPSNKNKEQPLKT